MLDGLKIHVRRTFSNPRLKRVGLLFWLEAEKIRCDRDCALAEMEENKKRFILKANYDPRVPNALSEE